MNKIAVKKENCLGCRLCEIVCSSVHFKVYNPLLARIRVPMTYPVPSKPMVCSQCSKPLCVEACSTGALQKRKWVEYDESLCTECSACVKACPFQSIWTSETKKILKCDLCGGTPMCVTTCPAEALVYLD